MRMSCPGLYGTEVYPCRYLQGGEGMPKAVWRDAGQAILTKESLQPEIDCFGVNRPSIILSEEALGLALPFSSPHESPLKPPAAILPERLSDKDGHINITDAALCFRGCLYDPLTGQVLRGPLYADDMILKIHIRPRHPAELAPAHSCKQCKNEGGFHPDIRLIHQSGQEGLGLIIV